MYESPVTIYETAMQTIMEEREGAIIAKIQSALGVDVDKGELLRALQYDRDQYHKGYADGKRDAMDELVRCKDCKLALVEADSKQLVCTKSVNWRAVEPDHFCSYGERREGE